MYKLPKRITTQLEKYKASSDAETSRAARALHAKFIDLMESASDEVGEILKSAIERLDMIHSLSLTKNDFGFLEPYVIRDVTFRLTCLANSKQNASDKAGFKDSSPPRIR